MNLDIEFAKNFVDVLIDAHALDISAEDREIWIEGLVRMMLTIYDVRNSKLVPSVN